MNKTIYLIDTIEADRIACSQVITAIAPALSIKNAANTDEFLQLVNDEGLLSPSIVIVDVAAITKLAHLENFLRLTNHPDVFPMIISSNELNGLEDKILNCGALRFYSKPYCAKVLHNFFNEVITDHLGL